MLSTATNAISKLMKPATMKGGEVVSRMLAAEQVKTVFVNVFGGITACDAVANGIVQAVQMLADKGEPVTKPLVVRLDGNNADLGQEILDDFAKTLPAGAITREDTMDGAARAAAELAASGQGQGA